MEKSSKIKNIVESKKQRSMTLRGIKRYKKKIRATHQILSGNDGTGFFLK